MSSVRPVRADAARGGAPSLADRARAHRRLWRRRMLAANRGQPDARPPRLPRRRAPRAGARHRRLLRRRAAARGPLDARGDLDARALRHARGRLDALAGAGVREWRRRRRPRGQSRPRRRLRDAAVLDGRAARRGAARLGRRPRDRGLGGRDRLRRTAARAPPRPAGQGPDGIDPACAAAAAARRGAVRRQRADRLRALGVRGRRAPRRREPRPAVAPALRPPRRGGRGGRGGKLGDPRRQRGCAHDVGGPALRGRRAARPPDRRRRRLVGLGVRRRLRRRPLRVAQDLGLLGALPRRRLARASLGRLGPLGVPRRVVRLRRHGRGLRRRRRRGRRAARGRGRANRGQHGGDRLPGAARPLPDRA